MIGSTNGFQACTIDIMDFSDFPDDLTGPLVSGATKTAILASLSVTEGVTRILNPYLKPDVTELLSFLRLNGFRVSWNKEEIVICPPDVPVDIVTRDKVTVTLLSDLSEVITYLTLSILSGKKIRLHCDKIDNVISGLQAEITLFRRIGINIIHENKTLYAVAKPELSPCDVVVKSTSIYSDHQPFFALILCYARGLSNIEERVWKHRFSYAHELNKMGTDIGVFDGKICINPAVLNSEPQSVFAQDLRSAAVLLIAAIVRNGETIITGCEHLERGYTHLIENLSSLGVNIHYLQSNKKEIVA
ncbi:hypothetical protein, partial [Erwinia sp. MYb416]